MEHLRQRLEELMLNWSAGSYTGERGDETLQLNAKAIGQAEALRSIYTLSYTDLYPEHSDETRVQDVPE